MKPILRNYIVSILSAISTLSVSSQTIKIEDLNIRDPYILADKTSNQYYLYQSADLVTGDGSRRGGVIVYTSKNLKEWEGPRRVMSVPENNSLTGGVWAPEVHKYNGKYYLFATINSSIKFKADREDWPSFIHRGTQIFHSDSPLGSFLPFSPELTTPPDWMSLDGTLWVENGTPYIIFCHEWVEMTDGTMNLLELKPDLSAAVGTPKTLFYASAPEWATGTKHKDGTISYVTDGCFLYKTKTGKLLMIWSSFSNDNYAIGIAESTTGSVKGPWRQQEEPLFKANGGHGMIFKTLDGDLKLVLHHPNNPGGAERAKIFPLEDCGDTLRLKTEK